MNGNENGDGPRNRLRENATSVASTVVTGVWLAALFTGQDWWLGALLLGYVVVVPVVALLFGDDDDREEWWDEWVGESSWEDWFGTKADTESAEDERPPASSRDALETLRYRYARGDLTDEQFERKLERLLETETLEDLEDRERQREHERRYER